MSLFALNQSIQETLKIKNSLSPRGATNQTYSIVWVWVWKRFERNLFDLFQDKFQSNELIVNFVSNQNQSNHDLGVFLAALLSLVIF